MDHRNIRGHSALRKGRVSLPGSVYLVTFATSDRAPLFLDHGMAMRTCRAIIDRRLWLQSSLLAWVLMPDHWHGMVQLGDGETLPRLVGRVKANSARLARAGNQSARRVWATSFHDRALRHDESIASAARYILMNPIRAGLAPSPGKYPYWDAAWI
jgi:putative transposase